MIRVLVVDDSAVVRQVLTRQLSLDPDIEVVGAAPDPYVARDLIAKLKPQVLTLDLEMPRMDGISFLRKLMQHFPLPTIVVSSLTPKGSDMALEAMRAGAIDVVCKPDAAYSVASMTDDLALKVKRAALVDMRHHASKTKAMAGPRPAIAPLKRTTNQIVAIGSSTGGTNALEVLFEQLPPDAPGIVISQHMPPRFTATFAARLNQLSRMEVREAKNGDAVVPGVALISPGDNHMRLARSGARYVVRCEPGPPINYHTPNIDVLMHSVAQTAGENAVGVILTGMGQDGAEGLLAVRNAGGYTIAQDEATSIVYGMPKVAFEIGGAMEVLPIQRVAEGIIKAASRTGAARIAATV